MMETGYQPRVRVGHGRGTGYSPKRWIALMPWYLQNGAVPFDNSQIENFDPTVSV